MEDDQNMSLADAVELYAVTDVDRSHAVRLLLKIYVLGPFRQETFFTSVAIMDYYLGMVR